MIKISKQEIKRYQKRWQAVHLIQKRERESMSISQRFKQLCHLMSVKDFLSGDKTFQKDIKSLLEIKKRWMTIYKRLRNG